MYREGECECFNTKEGADFAIGNIWELYVAQTVEGITNLITFKNFCSCDVQGRGAERGQLNGFHFHFLVNGNSFSEFCSMSLLVKKV